MTDVRDKRVVITGARGGIGSAVARRLRDRGARVVGIDLVGGDGVEAADVADRAGITAAMDRAAGNMGGIDILINNAGIGRAHDAGDFPDDDARLVMEVNFFGLWNATAAAMPHLLAQRGHVVNVSSGLALVDVPFAVAYAASKRAVDAYSAALRVEYRGRLSVTVVHPGFIRTSIHERAAEQGVTLEGIVRPDTVEQAATAIVRACVRKPRSIATSRLSTLEMWAARRFTRSTEWVLARRFRRWQRRSEPPKFLRFPT